MRGKLTIFRSDKTGLPFKKPPVYDVELSYDNPADGVWAFKPGESVVIDRLKRPKFTISADGIHIDGTKEIGGKLRSYISRVLYQRWYFRPEPDNA